MNPINVSYADQCREMRGAGWKLDNAKGWYGPERNGARKGPYPHSDAWRMAASPITPLGKRLRTTPALANTVPAPKTRKAKAVQETVTPPVVDVDALIAAAVEKALADAGVTPARKARKAEKRTRLPETNPAGSENSRYAQICHSFTSAKIDPDSNRAVGLDANPYVVQSARQRTLLARIADAYDPASDSFASLVGVNVKPLAAPAWTYVDRKTGTRTAMPASNVLMTRANVGGMLAKLGSGRATRATRPNDQQYAELMGVDSI